MTRKQIQACTNCRYRQKKWNENPCIKYQYCRKGVPCPYWKPPFKELFRFFRKGRRKGR